LRHSRADYSVAVTGVAGPGGGSEEKPVGTVWIAVASAGQMLAKRYQFEGDRQAVRAATLQTAIELLLELVNS
jgi:nicotinamide-nucleotide amidase